MYDSVVLSTFTIFFNYLHYAFLKLFQNHKKKVCTQAIISLFSIFLAPVNLCSTFPIYEFAFF